MASKNGAEKGHFGDIMAEIDDADFEGKSDLGTVTRQGKNPLFASFTGLERILLCANGNLQRIFASYLNENVNVVVLKNDVETLPLGLLLIHRKVHIQTCSRLLCTAYSTINISNPEICALVTSRAFGIGQLFRYLNILPYFSLLGFGRTRGQDRLVESNQDTSSSYIEEGAFWRLYRLDSTEQQGIKCLIREEFEPLHSSTG